MQTSIPLVLSSLTTRSALRIRAISVRARAIAPTTPCPLPAVRATRAPPGLEVPTRLEARIPATDGHQGGPSVHRAVRRAHATGTTRL